MNNLLALIGMAFFIKLFFDGAKQIVSKEEVPKRNFIIHMALGCAFIAAARLYVVFGV